MYICILTLVLDSLLVGMSITGTFTSGKTKITETASHSTVHFFPALQANLRSITRPQSLVTRLVQAVLLFFFVDDNDITPLI